MPTAILARRASNSRFKSGSGAFRCETCERVTRHTGEQSSDSRMCPDCFTLAGHENSLLDGCLTPADAPGVTRLFKIVVDKGGNSASMLKHFRALMAWASARTTT